MSRRSLIPALILSPIVLLGGFQPTMSPEASAQQTNCQTFRETGMQVCGKFLGYWTAHGGLMRHGFPISQQFTEVSEVDGKPYAVQYFERSQFELHPENVGTPYEVLLSLLGTYAYNA